MLIKKTLLLTILEISDYSWPMMLKMQDVHFCYQTPILRGVNLEVTKGEIVALIGCSGSGKTTLFRLITGLLAPSQGTIKLLEGPATYMQQEDLLLPWRTVQGNLLLLQELGSQKSRLCSQTMLQMLKLVGLDGYLHFYPDQLSGGQRQRLSLARALLQKRSLLLLDEPFGSLDVAIREQLYSLLLDIREQFEKTIVLVTHDFRDALELADRILVLRQGQIVAEFHVANTPADQITRSIRQLLQDSLNELSNRLT